ncbi:MAG: hypothetical protein OXR68_02015 [Alphaproteobacteria bacterium]|nr:hypothetical protein [Alphaproteobacteria bacterium]MDD9919386.1 hypothetical protein [Alphaproteobacteria bacterium]
MYKFGLAVAATMVATAAYADQEIMNWKMTEKQSASTQAASTLSFADSGSKEIYNWRMDAMSQIQPAAGQKTTMSAKSTLMGHDGYSH